MTTSWSFIRYFHTLTSSHHHNTRLKKAWGPSVGLEQGALEAYKEDYYRINASPGFGDGSKRGMTSIITIKDH